MSEENDPIRPAHYRQGTLEVIDVIEALGLDRDFLLGNTLKYIARARYKGKEIEDLKKATWYLQRKIKNLEKQRVEFQKVAQAAMQKAQTKESDVRLS